MKHLHDPKRSYKIAKARLASQTCKPESLTRRGETLIACFISPQWDKKVLQGMYFEMFRSLFPGADIQRISITPCHISRVYFSL